VSRHRQEVRPRYGRVTALGSAVAVTVIAVLGGVGVLPSAVGDKPPPGSSSVGEALDPVADSPSPSDSATVDDSERATAHVADKPVDDTALPPRSGSGKRVVFSEARQRVWLVSDRHRVQSTYLVSGSLTDNLKPGTYSVYSRSEQAWGVDDSGTMKYFVRFTQGKYAAIGFHDIPIDDGVPVQTVSQLGTPMSHGCIRQKRSDARALWKFAPIGTTVVVTA
jgi:lipoprotein-anchoring transpeptidase ErfK/SrfK